ncbi:MAG: DNA-3-methyladenine glycosylase family protein [Puniceicoccaceae bacterium]
MGRPPGGVGGVRGILPVRVPGGERVFAEILDGGQTFLWNRTPHGSWLGIHEGRVYEVSLSRDKRIAWACADEDPGGAETALRSFFAAATDFDALADALPWRSDPVLHPAMREFEGLRILRQPVETTLLSFLLSPLKKIAQIKIGLRSLSRRFGTPVARGLSAPPDFSALSRAGENGLRACGIGYRARSLFLTAKILAGDPGYLSRLETADTEAAAGALMALPGVGRKIADCVLLFGLGRLEAFPIDTWIGREMRRLYGLERFDDAAVRIFARAHFGAAAGLAQQFLFARARSRGPGGFSGS